MGYAEQSTDNERWQEMRERVSKLEAKLKAAEEALGQAEKKTQEAAEAFKQIGCTVAYHAVEWDRLFKAREILHAALEEIRRKE